MKECRFYGHNGMFGEMIPQDGNQCALVVTSYAPCGMECLGVQVDESRCPLIERLGGVDLATIKLRERSLG